MIVPPTTYPKPSSPSARRCEHDLSNPAASPMGLRNGIPASVVSSRTSSETPPTRDQGSGRPRRRAATPWAAYYGYGYPVYYP